MMAGRPKSRRCREAGLRGSALILTVVLTSLLAIVGVLFVMAVRIDKMGSAAAAESRELNFAVDTLVAQIIETLVEDVPGVDDRQEYYDFPDANNPWLAELEPYKSGSDYYWRRISDLAGALTGEETDVEIRIVGEHEAIDLSDTGTNADADGDGVGDSRWFEVPGIVSSKGRPIYAAVRIVDNGGMLNVNTHWKFVHNHPDPNQVDGTSQLQINAAALGVDPADFWTSKEEDAARALQRARTNGADDGTMTGLAGYEAGVIWTYGEPDLDRYSPFDLSDELELRYRYLLNHTDLDMRLEQWGRFRQNTISTPVDGGTGELDQWYIRATGRGPAGEADPNYAYRHVATIHSMDRIIMPRPLRTSSGVEFRKMVNVNTADQDRLRQVVKAALLEADPNLTDERVAAQIVANLVDFIDDDSQITEIDEWSSAIYGFERPCVYISELAYREVKDSSGTSHKSYAIELHKPYFEDDDPLSSEWQLKISSPLGDDQFQTITWSGTRRFHVLRLEDVAAPLTVNFGDPLEPTDTMSQYGYDPSGYQKAVQDANDIKFDTQSTIELQRKMGKRADNWQTVDYLKVPAGWIRDDGVPRSVERDISPHKCIRALWATAAKSPPTLGQMNSFVDEDTGLVQAHPADAPLTNIGQLGMVFAKSAYDVAKRSTAADLLLDLRAPKYVHLFKYLTVMDPTEHIRGGSSRETRVKGRVNINTAPAFVLAQLPWMQYKDGSLFERARAVVDYRSDRGAFETIAELMQVTALHSLAFDGDDNQPRVEPSSGNFLPGPDVIEPPDTALDDFEERDLIFTRISDLITVRSDVFTAYILVRIGTDGPQRRMMAIFDRSDVLASDDDVEVMVVYQVPDPR